MLFYNIYSVLLKKNNNKKQEGASQSQLINQCT